MTYYKSIFLISITFCFISCGKNKIENETKPTENNAKSKQQEPIVIATQQKKDSTYKKTSDSIKQTQESILSEKSYTKKSIVTNDIAIEKPVKNTSNPSEKITKSDKTGTNSKKDFSRSFVYIKKILSDCKIGVPMTQKDLETNYNIPKEGMQLVKSITKISENELDVKWKSTWAIEKISDAKFKDGRLIVRFEDNKMYTSGNAIGIKFKKKMYTDLILIGRSAYIPTVQGFYWQIGKD
jgi:hypothetical protein